MHNRIKEESGMNKFATLMEVVRQGLNAMNDIAGEVTMIKSGEGKLEELHALIQKRVTELRATPVEALYVLTHELCGLLGAMNIMMGDLEKFITADSRKHTLN